MVLVEVEGVEVEPLVLQLGALRDLPAHADEDVAHALHEQGEWMARADRVARGESRDIHRFLCESGRLLGDREHGLLRGDGLADLSACPADELARRGLLVARKSLDECVELCERRGLPRVRCACGLELCDRGRGGDRGERGLRRCGYGLFGDV